MRTPIEVLRAIEAQVQVLRYLTTSFSTATHFIDPVVQRSMPTPVIEVLSDTSNLAISLEERLQVAREDNVF